MNPTEARHEPSTCAHREERIHIEKERRGRERERAEEKEITEVVKPKDTVHWSRYKHKLKNTK